MYRIMNRPICGLNSLIRLVKANRPPVTPVITVKKQVSDPFPFRPFRTKEGEDL